MNQATLSEFCAMGKSKIQVKLDTLDSIRKHQLSIELEEELGKKWVADAVDAIRHCFRKLVEEVGELEVELVKRMEGNRTDVNKGGLKKYLSEVNSSNEPKINRVQISREEELERKLRGVENRNNAINNNNNGNNNGNNNANNDWKRDSGRNQQYQKRDYPRKEPFQREFVAHSGRMGREENEALFASYLRRAEEDKRQKEKRDLAEYIDPNGKPKVPEKISQVPEKVPKVAEAVVEKKTEKIAEKSEPKNLSEKTEKTQEIPEPVLPPLPPTPPGYPTPASPPGYADYKKLSIEEKKRLLRDPIEQQRILSLLQQKEGQRAEWAKVDQLKEADWELFSEKSEIRREILKGAY